MSEEIKSSDMKYIEIDKNFIELFKVILIRILLNRVSEFNLELKKIDELRKYKLINTGDCGLMYKVNKNHYYSWFFAQTKIDLNKYVPFLNLTICVPKDYFEKSADEKTVILNSLWEKFIKYLNGDKKYDMDKIIVFLYYYYNTIEKNKIDKKMLDEWLDLDNSVFFTLIDTNNEKNKYNDIYLEIKNTKLNKSYFKFRVMNGYRSNCVYSGELYNNEITVYHYLPLCDYFDKLQNYKNTRDSIKTLYKDVQIGYKTFNELFVRYMKETYNHNLIHLYEYHYFDNLEILLNKNEAKKSDSMNWRVKKENAIPLTDTIANKHTRRPLNFIQFININETLGLDLDSYYKKELKTIKLTNLYIPREIFEIFIPIDADININTHHKNIILFHFHYIRVGHIINMNLLARCLCNKHIPLNQFKFCDLIPVGAELINDNTFDNLITSMDFLYDRLEEIYNKVNDRLLVQKPLSQFIDLYRTNISRILIKSDGNPMPVNEVSIGDQFINIGYLSLFTKITDVVLFAFPNKHYETSVWHVTVPESLIRYCLYLNPEYVDMYSSVYKNYTKGVVLNLSKSLNEVLIRKNQRLKVIEKRYDYYYYDAKSELYESDAKIDVINTRREDLYDYKTVKKFAEYSDKKIQNKQHELNYKYLKAVQMLYLKMELCEIINDDDAKNIVLKNTKTGGNETKIDSFDFYDSYISKFADESKTFEKKINDQDELKYLLDNTKEEINYMTDILKINTLGGEKVNIKNIENIFVDGIRETDMIDEEKYLSNKSAEISTEYINKLDESLFESNKIYNFIDSLIYENKLDTFIENINKTEDNDIQKIIDMTGKNDLVNNKIEQAVMGGNVAQLINNFKNVFFNVLIVVLVLIVIYLIYTLLRTFIDDTKFLMNNSCK